MDKATLPGALASNSLTNAVVPETVNMQRSSRINSINIPGSLNLDGSASVHHLSPQQQQILQQLQQRADFASVHHLSPQQQQLQQQAGQGSVPMREDNYSHVDKRTRLEAKPEDMLQQQQILQQLIQRQDPTGRNPQLQALVHQQRLRQQQQMQILQSMSPPQRLQLQQQQQLRQQLQQQGTQQIPPNVRPYEVCARKLMMYLYHLRQRPPENCITYWRKFVAEYFSPQAKQRLCLSQYESTERHALGMFPQAAPDMWECKLCGAKSGKGFEATYDVLARLFEIKVASGIIDELLYLDHPRENRFPNGLMMLEYRKAVQETVHEQFRVVREGHLRIIFSQDLKILSWEFCVRRHEELLLRRLIAPQVNQLLQVAQKCQSTITESGPEGVSQQDLQSNNNMVLAAGRQLAKFMETPSLNDLGYPKRYIRTLQIAEAVKSMKGLMNFTSEHKIGPIEGLKRLSEQAATVKHQRQRLQEMEQLRNSGATNGSAQAQMASTPGTMSGPTSNNNNSNNHHQNVGRGAVTGSAQAAALTNYQSMLMRQNAMNNPNSNTGNQEVFSGQNSNQSSSSSSHQRQNLATGGFPSSPQMQQQQQRTMNAAPNMLQRNHPHHLQPPRSHGNNQEQEMSENRPSVQQQQTILGQSNAERNPTASASSTSGGGRVPSRNNSFTAASNNNLEDTPVADLSQEFFGDGFFYDSDIVW